MASEIRIEYLDALALDRRVERVSDRLQWAGGSTFSAKTAANQASIVAALARTTVITGVSADYTGDLTGLPAGQYRWVAWVRLGASAALADEQPANTRWQSDEFVWGGTAEITLTTLQANVTSAPEATRLLIERTYGLLDETHTDAGSAATNALTAASDSAALVQAIVTDAGAGLTGIPFPEADAGDGDVLVDHNYGGTDNYRVLDSDGVPADNVRIRAYVTADLNAGTVDPQPPETTTGSDGRWIDPLMLDPDTYTLNLYYPTTKRTKSQSLTVA